MHSKISQTRRLYIITSSIKRNRATAKLALCCTDLGVAKCRHRLWRRAAIRNRGAAIGAVTMEEQGDVTAGQVHWVLFRTRNNPTHGTILQAVVVAVSSVM